MGHNTELYCTQSAVRRGVEKQIKLQQTRGMQMGARAPEQVGGEGVQESGNPPGH